MDDLSRLSNELSKIKVKCNCSHTLLFPVFDKDIKICSYCGHKVYRNKKVEFKDKILCKIREVENGERKCVCDL